MFQYDGQAEKIQAESSRIKQRTISIDALQIPRERWVETQYWDRVKREAEEEAKRIAILEAKKKKAQEKARNVHF